MLQLIINKITNDVIVFYFLITWVHTLCKKG